MTDVIKFNPCPFCNGTIQIHRYKHITDDGVDVDDTYLYCFKCDVEFKNYLFGKSYEEMAKWWNKRYNPTKSEGD